MKYIFYPSKKINEFQEFLSQKMERYNGTSVYTLFFLVYVIFIWVFPLYLFMHFTYTNNIDLGKANWKELAFWFGYWGYLSAGKKK